MWPRARRLVEALQLALDQRPVQVEEREPVRLQPSPEDVPEERQQRPPGDGTATEPRDDVVHVRRQARQREPYVLTDDPTDADGERTLDDDYLPCVRRGVAHLFEGVWAEALDSQRAYARPLLVQLVDDLLDRAQHRPERNDDQLGVFGAVPMKQAAGRAAEHLLEPGRDLGHEVEGLHLLDVREVSHLRERFGTDHRADRDRLVGIEYLARLEARQERVDVPLLGDVDGFESVGEHEAVHAHHDRDGELLGQLERLDVEVGRLLGRLGVQLDPSAVALRHRVGVVVPDVDR